MTLEFEIKPIVLIDYLVTKLPDVDNEALAHQVEVYKDRKLSDNENAGRYEDNDLPNSKPINDFKEILVNVTLILTLTKSGALANSSIIISDLSDAVYVLCLYNILST